MDTAYAQDQPVQLTIPPQEIGTALNELARKTHVQIIGDGTALQGKRTQGINGKYTVHQALAKLLEGSGLDYTFTADNAVAVKEGPHLLDTVTITAPKNSDAFAGTEDKVHYYLPNASSALKTDTPILETPQSLTVVSRALMDDLQMTTVNDAMKNVVAAQSYVGNSYTNPMIRGFTGDGTMFRNGLKQNSQQNVDVGNLSSVEVIKGPMSGLYGRMDAGGMVDLITLRPQETARYSLQQQFGSFSTYRTVLDATGPLLDDKSLLYRLVFINKNNNSFRDYDSADHILVMPSLTWQPNDAFTISVNMEYVHDHYVYDSGIIATGSEPANVPISTFYADGVVAQGIGLNQNRLLVASDWTYRFNDDWKLTNRFSYSHTGYDQNILYQQKDSLTPTSTTYRTLIASNYVNTQNYAVNLDLTGQFDTGFIHHSTLLGFDFYRNEALVGGLSGTLLPTSIIPVQSIFAPNNNIWFDFASVVNTYQPNYSSTGLTGWNGLYLQDTLKMWDQLQILVGGRFDWADYGGVSGGGVPVAGSSIPMEHLNTFRPRFGLLYQPLEWVSLYANYVQSIGPNNTSPTGFAQPLTQVLAPVSAVQYEVGVKTEFFEKRLLTTLALFSITRSNSVAVDSNNNPYTIGQQRSKGVEFGLQGELTKNISLFGGYTYDSAKITRDTLADGAQGNMMPNVPLNAGNLWSKYVFDEDVLPGLSLGTGVYAVGMRQGSQYNTFQLPGYVRWDAYAAYSLKEFGGKISFQLNVQNILNKSYYANSLGGGPGFIFPGAPLSFMGLVRIEF